MIPPPTTSPTTPMHEEASIPGVDRDRTGRFAPGNTCAKGNPHAAQVSRLRGLLGAI